MLASDVMINQVFKVKESDTVRLVLEMFVEHGISGMPIVNDRNEVKGFVSDGDVMRNIGKSNPVIFDMFLYTGVLFDQETMDTKFHRLVDENVMLVATKKVISVPPDMEIERVASILGERKIKKVPVIRNGVLVGVISRGDIIRAVVGKYLNKG